jgi:cytochrome bd-type quinol oxidase subunit 2
MDSSTSRHGSFDRGLLAVVFTGIVATPLLWLATLQTGYVLAYQSCDSRSRTWVTTPVLAGLVVVAVIAVAAVGAHRRARKKRLPMPLLGWMAVSMSMLMVLVLAASTIAPFVLHPCD